MLWFHIKFSQFSLRIKILCSETRMKNFYVYFYVFLKSYRRWTVLTFKSISKDVKTPLTIPLLSYAELNFPSSKILLTDHILHCTAFHLQYTWHESEENRLGCYVYILFYVYISLLIYCSLRYLGLTHPVIQNLL